jgi:uncharacterized protein
MFQFMTNSRAFFRNHPVLTYFALTCTISWGALILFIIGQGGVPKTQEEFLTQMPLLIPAVLGGPSLGAILAIAMVSGKAGFRELFARLCRWRVGARWYAVALLSAPLVFIAVHAVLSTVSPDFRPGIITAGNRIPVLLMGIAGGITVGFFEELGWTGFAIPRLLQRYGMTSAGLRLGIMWAIWHLPFQRGWPGVALSGELPIAAFLITTSVLFLVGELVAYRILMVRVYQHTNSLPVAILMHTSLTACSLIIGPAVISGSSLLVYDVALAAGWWLVVAVVAVAGRWTAQEVINHKPAQDRSLAGM